MRINVLFLCSYFPNRLRKAGNFIQRHAIAAHKFADVKILSLEPDAFLDLPYELVFENENSIPTVIAYYSIKCKNIPILRSLIIFSRFLKAGFAGYRLITSKYGKPEITHLNVIRPLGIFALILKFWKKIPYVITEHSTIYLDENKNGMTFIEYFFTLCVLRQAKKIMPVSKLLQSAIIKRFHIHDEKFNVVSNVVSTDIFGVTKQKAKPAKIKFLHISNMKPFKNVEGLIRTISLLSKERNNFELHIIGNSSEKITMEQLSKDLGLFDKYVFFHSQKSEKEIAEWMHKSDCFILFSHYETASMVVMESLCCGLPVIGTKVGVVPEIIINEKNGFLIDVNDEKALLHACKEFIDNVGKYNNPQNFQNYSELFSENTIGNQFNKIYKTVLSL